MTYSKGTRLHDARRDRVVVLDRRVNPFGPIGAYWIVRNEVTGRVSVIREDRLDENRWSDADEQEVEA